MAMPNPGSDDLRWGDRIIRRDGPHWCTDERCCDEDTILPDAMLDYMVSYQYWTGPGQHEPLHHAEHLFLLNWQEHIFGNRRIPHPSEYEEVA